MKRKQNIFAVDIATGENHSIITALDGKIYGFGSNHFGQLCILCFDGVL